MELPMKDFSKFVSCCLYSETQEEFDCLFKNFNLSQEQLRMLIHSLVHMFDKEDYLTVYKLSTIRKLFSEHIPESLIFKLLQKKFSTSILAIYDSNVEKVLQKYKDSHPFQNETCFFLLNFF